MNRFHKMYKKRAIADANGQLRGVPVGIALTYRNQVKQYAIDHHDSLGIAGALATSNWTDLIWDLGDSDDFFGHAYTKREDAAAFANWGHYHVTGPEAACLTGGLGDYSAWLEGPMKLCTARITPALRPIDVLLVFKRLPEGLYDVFGQYFQAHMPRPGDPRLFESPFTAEIPAPKPLSAAKKPLVVLSIDLEDADIQRGYHHMYVATKRFFDRRAAPSLDRGFSHSLFSE